MDFTSGSDESGESKTFVNAVKAANGKALIGKVLTIGHPFVANLAGQAPGEFVMIDMEHAPMTIDVVTQMVSSYVTSSRGAKYPIVRIPSHGVASTPGYNPSLKHALSYSTQCEASADLYPSMEQEWVKWALDSGAAGIIVPMVNNAKELRDIIDRAIYPPGGRRSFGPIVAPFAHPDGAATGMGAYFARAKAGEIALLPMIESKEGLENCEEILSMEHVSGTFVGPADLRLSLGMPPAIDGTEPEFLDAMKKIVNIAKKHGKVAGTMGMGEDAAKKRAAEGYDFLLSTFDNGAMVSGFARDLEAARKGVENAASSKL